MNEEPVAPNIAEARTPEELLQFNILNCRERVIAQRKKWMYDKRYFQNPPIIYFKAEVDSYYMYCRGAFDEKESATGAQIEALLKKNDYQSIDDAFRLIDNWFRFIGLVKIDNKLRFSTATERNKHIFG